MHTVTVIVVQAILLVVGVQNPNVALKEQLPVLLLDLVLTGNMAIVIYLSHLLILATF